MTSLSRAPPCPSPPPSPRARTHSGSQIPLPRPPPSGKMRTSTSRTFLPFLLRAFFLFLLSRFFFQVKRTWGGPSAVDVQNCSQPQYAFSPLQPIKRHCPSSFPFFPARRCLLTPLPFFLTFSRLFFSRGCNVASFWLPLRECEPCLSLPARHFLPPLFCQVNPPP